MLCSSIQSHDQALRIQSHVCFPDVGSNCWLGPNLFGVQFPYCFIKSLTSLSLLFCAFSPFSASGREGQWEDTDENTLYVMKSDGGEIRTRSFYRFNRLKEAWRLKIRVVIFSIVSIPSVGPILLPIRTLILKNIPDKEFKLYIEFNFSIKSSSSPSNLFFKR